MSIADKSSKLQDTPTGQTLQQLFAEVVFNIPLNKLFHYSVPPDLRELLTPGMRVKAPFGNKVITGFCVGLTTIPSVYKTKDLMGILDAFPLADETMLRITKWLSSYYCCGWGEAIHAVIPPVVRRGAKEKIDIFVTCGKPLTAFEKETILQSKKRAIKQARVLEFLFNQAQNTEIRAKDLMKATGGNMSMLRQLERENLLRLEERQADAVNALKGGGASRQHLALSEEQQAAFTLIKEKLSEPSQGIILLHGITGSGKTELYLQTIAKLLEQGKKALFLVPEISLTSQSIQRIKERFNNVAVLHSHLQGAFHHAQWKDIKEGRVDVVVGARSSIFAPLKDVGLIILDEEHENTYKQENSPRYNARDIAILRATYENAMVILGTATPSLESYYEAEKGNYTKIVLSKRIGTLQLPQVEIVDMLEEVRKKRGYHVVSQRLEYYMKQALSRREQVILFLNRRGFTPYIHCKRCGFVLKCHRCDIPLTFHKKLNIVLCHYCHAEAIPPESCPDCMANYINYRGFGTEKIEEVIAKKFPGYNILRMDSDSMRSHGSHEKALKAFGEGEFQILLGTQMIAKGLDFPNVTLVGVISADTMLNLPDFRAGERTFQLISQVAGRTGRGQKGGRVIVQSFNPRHYSITYAAAHDYEGFAKKELEYRRPLNYPPFGRMARIIFRGASEKNTEEKASVIAGKLKEIAKESNNQLQILGPSPAPVMKINNLFRWHLLLKAKDHQRIHDALLCVADTLKPTKGVQSLVDVDPYMML
ncbi:primosomal protein N' [Candidatus Kuenenia stuttgartiensis]|jgi:primosomal protein N' (replication factor Y)|uniref:Replication restart protein PriA n=1 Tax=Kuenenia stuttgartiensis TaxID=174633 RepID=A0A6G7GVP6_KUEST|nr:primosomal protein N' [Candidatus Kuenenia stuttgartiensis]MBE7547941.1 primosomal protein N' [Planctomycetia bacterium]MBZ0192924.1 primosomal protein N' [Candidatus Kuenenia stuttgartiensis]MCL4727236.1 primosomal protein N' [Candidatus Kuenenia stuttgartiensis]QII13585.1 primosomal protein N' [Candidatus Kuenenia stuttgartiensis]